MAKHVNARQGRKYSKASERDTDRVQENQDPATTCGGNASTSLLEQHGLGL